MPQQLYVNHKGYPVTRLSHSAFAQYRESGAKFKWQRLFGWRQRMDGAPQRLGDDVQESIVQFYNLNRSPVETFTELWNARVEQELDYGESCHAKFLEHGQGLMCEFERTWKDFP